jgi:hypothetical protein
MSPYSATAVDGQSPLGAASGHGNPHQRRLGCGEDFCGAIPFLIVDRLTKQLRIEKAGS